MLFNLFLSDYISYVLFVDNLLWNEYSIVVRQNDELNSDLTFQSRNTEMKQSSNEFKI